MPPVLEQAAYNSTSKRGDGDEGSTSVRATFSRASRPGSLIVAVAVTGGGLEIPHYISSSGFSLLGSRSYAVRDLQVTVWYRENSPAMTSLTVSTIAYRSMQVRLMEYSGVAQASPRDKFAWAISSSENSTPSTPYTQTLASSGQLVLGVIANQYASTTQFGYTGGLARLYDSTSPSSGDEDWERTRVSIHQAIPSSTASNRITSRLSTGRRWISLLFTFRSGTSGPARFTATLNTKMLSPAGSASLTVFGKLRSGFTTINSRMLREIGSPMARIGPFNYQYRLGGWSGLLIGQSTDYRVESIDGLEGWNLRTSDDELPRGDGALRGVDLQTARQVMFRLNFDGSKEEIEEKLDVLYRALIPQRDSDWELIYRHPGRPLRILYCRPTDLIREMSQLQLLLHTQSFALKAVDPRIYSAVEHSHTQAVSPNNNSPSFATVLNLGNAFAYPEIRVSVPSTSPTVERIELVNETADSVFDFRALLPPRSTLLADMSARATGASRQIVTVDGQSKYGAWQFPREVFRLNPGQNDIYLRTYPQNIPVLCILRYRDTWSG